MVTQLDYRRGTAQKSQNQLRLILFFIAKRSTICIAQVVADIHKRSSRRQPCDLANKVKRLIHLL